MGGITDAERGLQPFFGASSEPATSAEDRFLGLHIIDRTEIERMVRRTLALLTPRVAAVVRADFKEDSQLPRKRLEHSHWPSEQDRLTYLRHMIELSMSLDGSRADPETVVQVMVEYEVRRQAPQLAVHDPPTEPERGQLRALRTQARAEHDRREYEAYLKEVAHIQGVIRNLQQQRNVGATIDPRSYPMVFHARTPLDPVAEELRDLLNWAAGKLSLIVDFIPIIGQLKGLTEAAVGHDIFTGEALPKWQRGLTVLLSLVPFARGAYKVGRAGVRAISAVAVQAMRHGYSARQIYLIMKGAGRLTEAEVALALALKAGKRADPTQLQAIEKIAGSLDEMTGSTSRGFRATSGTIVDGRSVARSSAASAPTKASKSPKAAKAPGRVVKATKITAAAADSLAKAGISSAAAAALSRVGVKLTDKMLRRLAIPEVAAFVNRFHSAPGFERILQDLASSARKQKGARFVIDFVMDRANQIDPRFTKFELPAGITKGRAADLASRFVDVVVHQGGRTINYEFKAWTKASLKMAFENPEKLIQLVKDIAMFGREGTRWVFNSAQIARDDVLDIFSKAIRKDPVLASKFPTWRINKALDDLIVMHPPVLKPSPSMPIPLHGLTKPFVDEDENSASAR